MKSLKISVVVPVYNGEKYLSQCLDMLFDQSYKNLEIIVVDDGSTDGTAEIAARYDNIKYIHHPNQGLSVTRNRGADIATGDYIHFLDVDDAINLDFYTRMSEAIGLTGADMAFCGFYNESRPYLSLSFDERLLLTIADDKFAVTRVGVLNFAWRYLIRTSFYRGRESQFTPGVLFEDLYFTMPALLDAAKVVTVPGAMYYYKKRAGSILQSRDKAFQRNRDMQWKRAKAYRDEFYRIHNIAAPIMRVEKIRYRFLNIPLVKRERFSNERTVWTILGLRLWERRHSRV